MYGSPITGVLNTPSPVSTAIAGYAVAGISVAGVPVTQMESVVNLPNSPKPVALVLNSNFSSRLIEFSLGNQYYSPVTPDFVETSQIVYILKIPVASVRFSGQLNDTYTILS